MSFGSFYLNARKVTVDAYTGQQIVCENCRPDEHRHFRLRRYGGECETCDMDIVACGRCQASITCCACGNYHSIDCPWPL